MKKLFLFGAVLALCIISCSKGGDEPPKPIPPEPEPPTEIPITISTNVWSRATDTGYESGDKVGIYVVNHSGNVAGSLSVSGNHANNIGFTYSNSVWSSATPIYWADNVVKADFYCYYPYSSPSSVTAYPLAVNTNQSIEANYKASDFLWGKTADVAPSPNPVNIITKHMMSNLLVYLVAGNGYTAENFNSLTKSVIVCNTKPNGTINLSTGIVTATGEVADITPKVEGSYYRALVIPQTVSDLVLIKVTVEDKEYSLTKTITFEANKQHTCTITVNRTEGGINIGIGDWETDDEDKGGTVE